MIYCKQTRAPEPIQPCNGCQLGRPADHPCRKDCDRCGFHEDEARRRLLQFIGHGLTMGKDGLERLVI